MDKIEIKGKKVFEGEKAIKRTKEDNRKGGCDYCEHYEAGDDKGHVVDSLHLADSRAENCAEYSEV